MEGSQEEHREKHVHSKVKEEPTAKGGIDVMTPDPNSYKRREELSTAPPELGSSGGSAIGVSDLDPMMIDSGEALRGRPPGASVGDADNRVSQVGSADAAPSRSKTCIATAIVESKAIPEEDLPESDAEPESQWSPEFQCPPWCESDVYSDFDLSESKGDSKNEGHEMEFPDAVWFMREKSAWETKSNGLFVCMTINDVVKHCLEKMSLDTALNIWELKINRNLKYWRFCDCDMWFPDQKSHMWHMESMHGLGFPCLSAGWCLLKSCKMVNQE